MAAGAAEKPDDSWLQRYYEHPQPERFEQEVAKWQKAGALHSPNALPPTAAFFSRLFQTASAEQLDRWCAAVRGLPRADQKVFLIALWWADTPATKDALRAFIDQAGPDAESLRELWRLPPPDFTKLNDPAPGELDMCWGAFFATGEAAYALPVIRCAVRPAKEGVADLTRQAARWSLKALCATHPRLREIRDRFYETAAPQERRSLDELFKE